MPNPVAVNDLSPISGSLQTSRISYGVETAGKNYGQAYNGTTWYSDIPQNGSQYTIISDNYTANYYVSRSNAGGAYVEGGLPAVDEYSAPVFWLTAGTSSLDIITIVNGLPDRIGQVPFNSGSQALNWIISSSNYFAVGPPYEQIDADQLALCLDASQVISYPTTMSTWYDISGNNYKTTLTNGPTFNSSYGSITFDGSDDYGVFTGTGGDILPSSSYSNRTATWEGTVRFSTSTGVNAVTTKWDNTSGENWWFGRYPSNTVHLALQTSAGYQGLYSSTTIGSTTTQFQYIAVTTSGSNYVFYINGANAGSGTYSGTWSVPDLDTPVVLGAQNTSTGGAAFFGGDIANTKLYSKALTASDIAQNYYGGPIVTSSLSFMLDAGNLVSYPKTGTAVYTLTGSVNGTLTNGPTFNPTFGGCWNFDGTDDYILLGSSITPGNGNWTLSAWVRGYGGVVGNTSGGPVASGFGVFSTGGNYKIFYANYDGSWNYNYGNTTLNPNEWYFLTWVNYTGNTMKMYVNGVADSSVFNSLTSNGGPVDAVGGTQGTPGGTFNGNIASVQWNIGTAFTDAQVLQNYNATK